MYDTNNASIEEDKKRIEIEVEFINEYLEEILIFELQFFRSQRIIKVGSINLLKINKK